MNLNTFHSVLAGAGKKGSGMLTCLSVDDLDAFLRFLAPKGIKPADAPQAVNVNASVPKTVDAIVFFARSPYRSKKASTATAGRAPT